MERPLKPRTPNLSLILPPNPSPKKHPVPAKPLSHQFSPRVQTPTRNVSVDGISPPKQKRLFPIACRLVSTDQWFTSRIDRTWNVLDLKIWLLSKALPTQILPLPASYRPSSPVTFAAAPPPPPRPSTSLSYRRPSTSHTHQSSSPTLSPSPPVFSPATSPPVSSPPEPASPTVSIPSSSSSRRFSLDQYGEDFPLYANPYGAMLDDHDDLDIDDDDLTHVVPRSIPYSFKTGAPAISGLQALKSNQHKAPARGFGVGTPGVDVDLVRKAETIARKWQVFSFSMGMLLSDELPLSEYNIHPYELLELHRAGAYALLPRTTLPTPQPSSNLKALHPPMAHPASTHTARAYHSTTTRRPSLHSPAVLDARDPSTSESSDEEYDDMATASPYAQPYFDGWVWILREGAGGSTGLGDMAAHSVPGPEAPSGGRKVRRRGRAKSEAAKAGKGKDRGRMEREWQELQPQLREAAREDNAETERRPKNDWWKKRWLIVREGFLTVWRERKDETPEDRFRIGACAGLYGADKLPSIVAATSPNVGPWEVPIFAEPTPSHTPKPIAAYSALSFSSNVICARFRQSPLCKSVQIERAAVKASRKTNERHGSWLVMKLADETSHEHLLRIFHRLSYSSPVESSGRPSTASSVAQTRAIPTRTLRTDFLPNPIPHPLSLSFSAPSPLSRGDDSPISSFDNINKDGDDGEWLEDPSMWGRARRKGQGKPTSKFVGLGHGMGVRFPEWREEVIRKAIRAGQGKMIEDEWGVRDASVHEEIPPDGEPDLYGFIPDDAKGYAAYLAREEYDSDDADSDAFSEAEWDGWAYDLDRAKVVDEVDTGLFGHIPILVRGGLATPQGSPASDAPEVTTTTDGASTPSTSTVRQRSQSFNTSSPTLTLSNASVSSLSPASATTPTTPGTRMRASTVSVHLRNTTFAPRVQSEKQVSRVGSSSERNLRTEETTSVRTVETNSTGGVRGLMRGLSMRAGRESLMRGLENALDFVEGK